MSALTWGTDVGYAGSPSSPRAGHQRPHLVLVPAGPARVATTSGLRLTRRGRLALVVLVVSLMAALGVLTGLRSAGAAEPARVVTVEAGQTLSQIAAAELPDYSISAGIVAIQLENGLSTAQVSAGQRLMIPEG
ncbi:MAG TPA: LysM peptidoglycan-binding domain-containing protein [Ornithinibacter sp.]|nr:LysM peptidoglycan-binding domain-containing protein [Ornithinibacter sp.]